MQISRSEVELVNISVRDPVSFSPNPFNSFTTFTIYIEVSMYIAIDKLQARMSVESWRIFETSRFENS